MTRDELITLLNRQPNNKVIVTWQPYDSFALDSDDIEVTNDDAGQVIILVNEVL